MFIVSVLTTDELYLRMFSCKKKFCNLSCLLITFAISLDPDKGQHNVSPDLDATVWHSDSVLIIFV